MIQEIAGQIKQEEIRRYWSFLESMPFSIDRKEIIEQKIGNALDKIKDTGELDTIIKNFEDLQKQVDSIARSIPDYKNNPNIILLQYISITVTRFLFWSSIARKIEKRARNTRDLLVGTL